MYKTRIKNLELQTDRYEYLHFVLFDHNTSIQTTNLTSNFKGPYKIKKRERKREKIFPNKPIKIQVGTRKKGINTLLNDKYRL